MKRGFKIISVIMLSLSLAFIMTGCKEKKIVVPKYGAAEPDMEKKANVQIDWDQVKDELEAVMISEEHPLVSYVDFAVYEDKNTIRIILPLKNEATQIESLDYGKAYIKAFNDAAAIQDFSIAKSTSEYYGGLWDKYNLELEVFKEDDVMQPELYYVNQAIDAGSNAPVIPQIIGDSTQTESTKESN